LEETKRIGWRTDRIGQKHSKIGWKKLIGYSGETKMIERGTHKIGRKKL
jgi:hypothetical protein